MVLKGNNHQKKANMSEKRANMSEKRGKGPGFTRVIGKAATAINGVMQKIKAEKNP